MMRRGARLHRHHAWRQRGEKRDELGAPELAGNNDLAIGVDRVDLKDPLRQIQTDPRDTSKIPDRLAHGRLPFRRGFDNDHLGTLMPFGAPSTPSFADAWRTGQIDALPPFKIGPVTGREAGESGLRLKASIAPEADGPRNKRANTSVRPKAPSEQYRLTCWIVAWRRPFTTIAWR
jgi:hypothetical protein